MAPARYMKFRPKKPSFSWTSDPIAPDETAKPDCNYYRGCSVGDITIEVNDFVIVKNEHFQEVLDGEVVRVDRLYEDPSYKADPYRAKVTWLCRPNLFPKNMSKEHGFEEQGSPPLNERIDVVVEARKYHANISIESIILKCKVYPQPMTTNPEQFLKKQKSSEVHQYVLRFKMVAGKKKNQFTLSPYQMKGEPSPLKLSSLNISSPAKRSPLAEKSRNLVEDHLNSNMSPEIVKIKKISIPEEQMAALKKDLSKASASDKNNQGFDHDIADGVKGKRRRLSSRDGSREQTPVKRLKKSSSVQNSPDTKSTDKESVESPSRSKLSRSTRKSSSTQNTPEKSTNVLTIKSASVTRPTRTRRQSEIIEQEEQKSETPKRSTRRSIVPSESQKSSVKKESEPKKTGAKTETPARSAKGGNVKTFEGFTEVTSQTGSGRKIKITCGDKKKIAKSSGLDSGAISNLLDSCSDEEFEEEVPKKKPLVKESKAETPNKKPKAKSTSTAKKKSDKKELTKVTPESPPKKRTRRARTSVVERPVVTTTTPVNTNKRRSVALSETKAKSKKIQDWSSGSEYESESEKSSEDDFSDEEFNSKKQKKRKLLTSPGSKVKSLLDRKGFKPGVQQRSKPVPESLNPLVEAQARLHVSAVPDQLPCREEEFAEVLSFVEGKLEEGTGGCIYISGVPGTGKTATVKQVMRYMQENSEDYPEFNFHELNGMRLTCPEQIYVEMWRMLSGGEKLSAEAALKRLDARFSQSSPKREPTVFLVDELDMLCKRKQTVLYNIFEWPSRARAKLIIIAIANTMDLPERDMDMRVISRLGFNRLNFEPYRQEQLQIIVSSRLEGLEVFQSDEIQLVSRKVASLSGDARRALDICRILAERCEREGKKRVTKVEVLQVHKEMYTSPKMLFIRSCSHMEQLLLKSMVNEFYRTGVEETNLRNISNRMNELCKAEGGETPTLFCLYNLCARLSSQRLILAEDYRKGLDTKLRLNVGFEDVNFALRPPQPLD